MRSLCSGLVAGKDVAVADDAPQLFVVGSFQLGAADHLERAGAAEAHLDADGAGGAGVVAGDHLDPDAGGVTGGDRLHGFRARRVDDADQSEKDHPVIEVVLAQADVRVIDAAGGGGQHAQAFLAEAVDLAFPPGAVERHRLSVGAELLAAAVEQAVGRALEQDATQAGRRAGERGHELVGRLKGDCRVPGMLARRESRLVRQGA